MAWSFKYLFSGEFFEGGFYISKFIDKRRGGFIDVIVLEV